MPSSIPEAAANTSPHQTFRLAVIDSDSGFITVLTKRVEQRSWQLRQASSGVPPEELVAMKLDGLLADPSVLGEEGLDYLGRVCERLPHLGVIVCTGRSTVAQRVRGLRLGVDDWITKPCHPEEAIARGGSRLAPAASRPCSARFRPAHRRRAGDPHRSVPGLRLRWKP
jgi:DNA-binding response OmpR family regulator